MKLTLEDPSGLKCSSSLISHCRLNQYVILVGLRITPLGDLIPSTLLRTPLPLLFVIMATWAAARVQARKMHMERKPQPSIDTVVAWEVQGIVE